MNVLASSPVSFSLPSIEPIANTTTTTKIVFPLIITSFNFASSEQQKIRFAVIGDYGDSSSSERGVAKLIEKWQTDFIITTGDNNYEKGKAKTIDANIGRYYSQYIYPYIGSYPSDITTNKFYPSLGNHDWQTGQINAYLDYFSLGKDDANGNSSQNERYYDFIKGDVHFFALDSDPHEPDGTTSGSKQAQWLKEQLATSTASWQIVYFHHPPYSSSRHGSHEEMQWPFTAWGADAVLSGHDHTYERLSVDGISYFVNGLGGRSIYGFGKPEAGSKVRYNKEYGAMLVEADAEQLIFQFINTKGEMIDDYSIEK